MLDKYSQILSRSPNGTQKRVTLGDIHDIDLLDELEAKEREEDEEEEDGDDEEEEEAANKKGKKGKKLAKKFFKKAKEKQRREEVRALKHNPTIWRKWHVEISNVDLYPEDSQVVDEALKLLAKSK